jgi:hypothetical protein
MTESKYIIIEQQNNIYCFGLFLVSYAEFVKENPELFSQMNSNNEFIRRAIQDPRVYGNNEIRYHYLALYELFQILFKYDAIVKEIIYSSDDVCDEFQIFTVNEKKDNPFLAAKIDIIHAIISQQDHVMRLIVSLRIHEVMMGG